jgi:hemerythrin
MSHRVDWQSDYAVGDERIDAQHRHLFHLANSVFDLEGSAADTAHLQPLVVKVYEYMKYHFEDEEELMKSVGFSELESHQALHQKLIQGMNSVMKSSKNMGELLCRLGEIMRTWTLTHIVVNDAQVAEYLKHADQRP